MLCRSDSSVSVESARHRGGNRIGNRDRSEVAWRGLVDEGAFTRMKVLQVHTFEGLQRADVPEASAGDIVALSGIEGVRRIKARWPEVDIVMLTVHADSELIFDSLAAGACVAQDASPSASPNTRCAGSARSMIRWASLGGSGQRENHRIEPVSECILFRSTSPVPVVQTAWFHRSLNSVATT